MQQRLVNLLNLFMICTLLTCASPFIQAAEAVETSSITASNTTTQYRPNIGLVLSGGGARGFAHIGVLRVLEENNVPVDYVVGTSMGSIIGGLYAIGLSPDDIENGVKGINWDTVFEDFAVRDYKSYRRKQDDYDFFNIHRIGITDDGLQISPGLIEGQQIELALDRLAHPGFGIEDYDKLSIPYRAVATDIATGEPAVIKSGNIARAMRASMSIPGALPPINIDGKLLVDGGIANNIPIDVVRQMGADIVIVVDVSAPYLKQDDITSGLDVTGQLTTILTRRIADAQLKTLTDNDILIVPGEKDISSSDFSEYEKLIAAGTTATTEQLTAIKKLSLDDKGYADYKASLPDIAEKNPVIDFIEIENNTSLRDDVMRVRIQQKIGAPLDIPQLEKDLSYIYGLDYSGSVVYSVEERDGKHGLIIYVRDRDWAHNYIQFGLDMESSFQDVSITNFSASYNNNHLNDLAGEFRAVAAIGSEPKLTAQLYQPVDAQLETFFSLKGGVKTQIVPTLINEHIVSVQRFDRIFATLSVGKIVLQNTSLSLGYSYIDGKIKSISGLEAIHPDFIESYYFVKLFHDSLDNLSFPNSGFYSSFSFTSNQEDLGAEADYDQIKLTISGATSYKRYTVFGRAIAETTTNEDSIPLNAFLVNGGFMQLSGTIRNELLSPHFGLVEAAFYRRIGDNTFLPIYSGFSLEAGNAWDGDNKFDHNDLRLAGSLFIGADTFMGPLYFAVGATDRGEHAVYLSIGKSFLIN